MSIEEDEGQKSDCTLRSQRLCDPNFGTRKAREFLGLPASTLFRLPSVPAATKAGFTLAQKMVGRAACAPAPTASHA
jgi:hypothetical protein